MFSTEHASGVLLTTPREVQGRLKVKFVENVMFKYIEVIEPLNKVKKL